MSQSDDTTPSTQPWPEGLPRIDMDDTQVGLTAAREMYLGLIRAEFTEDQACKIVAHCLMTTA